MHQPSLTQSRSAGFTLLQVSILLTAAAIVMVSVLPGKDAGDFNQKALTTTQKLEKVETAMRAFMLFNGRRPCPADGQYDINNANFGVEAATAGTCTGGTPASPFGPDAGTGFIVGGTIPTKSLNLPDEYAFDEWGRRITYVVDKRVTLTSSCMIRQVAGSGGVAIHDSTGATVANIMYAYISHGQDGHGAFPAQGSSVANRINSGSSDTDTLVNAGVNSSFTYNTTNFTNVKVKKDKTSTFDDIVYYQNDIKNTCCMGTACVPVGFRIDGITNGAAGTVLTYRGHGDINGDGIQDIVLGNATQWLYEDAVYVVFGKTTWPTPPTGFAISSLDGTTGFKINGAAIDGSAYSGTVVGDINGDGYDDIAIGVYLGVYVIFGGSGTWPAIVNANNDLTGSYTGVNGTSGLKLWGYITAGGKRMRYTYPAIGDVDGDGSNDIVAVAPVENGGAYANEAYGYVIYGRPTNDGTANDWQSFYAGWHDLRTMAPTSGFLFTNDNTGGSSTEVIGATNLINDIDEDGYKDIVISGRTSHGGYGSVYVLNGRPRSGCGVAANCWPTGATPSTIYLADEIAAGRGTRFHVDSAIATWQEGGLFGSGRQSFVDMNGDGHKDLILGDYYNSTYIWYGTGSRPATSYDLYSNVGSGVIRILQYYDGDPDGEKHGGTHAVTGDLNRDGRQDLLFACRTCELLGRTSPGLVDVYYQPVTGWLSSSRAGTDYTFNGTNSFQFAGASTNDYITYYGGMDVFDANDDGIDDVLVSDPYCYPGGTPNANRSPGCIYVYYGTSSGTWSATTDLNDLR